MNFFDLLKEKAQENFLPDNSNAIPVWEIMRSAVDAGRDVLVEKSAENFRSSPVGKRVETEATSQKIMGIITGPIGIVFAGILILIVARAILGRK